MAAAQALGDRRILSNILHQLSDKKYKVRRQFGPDQPVEFLEFRPTLVPSILVNRLWADEGIAILWRRYPHLPALSTMEPARRQYYADKVHQVFSLSPPPELASSFEYLEGLQWPNLKVLELELEWARDGINFESMLHSGLQELEISGYPSDAPEYFSDTVLPSLSGSCKNLKRICFGPGLFSHDSSPHSSSLHQLLDAVPSLSALEIRDAPFMDKDSLFIRLSQRASLEHLEIDLEPGLALLPSLEGPNAISPAFSSLKRMSVMCYPEVALALLPHLPVVENIQLDICRVATLPAMEADISIFEDLLVRLAACPRLRKLKIGVGALGADFPTASTLPRISGTALVGLASSCPDIQDINLLATEPSAIDGSQISREDFDAFCELLPRLKNLSLKLHPATAADLHQNALQSLGRHCPELEILRLKVAFDLASLPVPEAVPRVLVDGASGPGTPTNDITSPVVDTRPAVTAVDLSNAGSNLFEAAKLPPLFPHLTHLALARPENVLAMADDTFAASSSSSHDGSSSIVVDPDLEEDIVRSWAHPLLFHFPSLEILEAWGDWSGQDNESLNYFLPTEEILASTWEFLSGAEQDLWEEDDQDEPNWQTYESGEEWDTKSYVDSLASIDGSLAKVAMLDEESDEALTPGRILTDGDYFDYNDVHTAA